MVGLISTHKSKQKRTRRERKAQESRINERDTVDDAGPLRGIGVGYPRLNSHPVVSPPGSS